MWEPVDLGQLNSYMVMAKHVLNAPEDNPPVGMLVCKGHNHVLAKLHLEELGLPMDITDYELKKIFPTQTQLAKCKILRRCRGAIHHYRVLNEKGDRK